MKDKLINQYQNLLSQYDELKSKNYKLDITRGKASPLQLDLSMALLNSINENDYFDVNNVDCRNYGEPFGLLEMRKIFADMINTDPQNIIIGNNSSLNLMFDLLSSFIINGVRGNIPWSKLEKIKFLCPAPGYDRHFLICEHLNIEMITIKMLESGPDMDMIEKLINEDELIKGIWCVPKYSNPEGIVFSDEVVKRFANLKPKAKDFVIMWDNAYCLHKLYDEDIPLLDILSEAKKANNPNLVYEFASFSKISFGGSAVSCIASSEENIELLKKRVQIQTIGSDKLNQLRHIKFFKNVEGVKKHLEKHADILRPKFEIVLNYFNDQFKDLNYFKWSNPNGGYFISFYAMKNTAKRIVELCDKCGLTLVKAGSVYPYYYDENDMNIRIAPSFPSAEDLKISLEIFCICVKIAAIEKLNEI